MTIKKPLLSVSGKKCLTPCYLAGQKIIHPVILGPYSFPENIYDAGLKFSDVNGIIRFEMIFDNANLASDYIQLTDDTKINGTYRSQMRMNAFFASYPNL